MLEKDIKIANSKKSFDEECTGEYFVNMAKNVRTLHKRNCSTCQYADYAFEYIPFDSLTEVEAYEKKHKDATPFKRCGNCFKKR